MRELRTLRAVQESVRSSCAEEIRLHMAPQTVKFLSLFKSLFHGVELYICSIHAPPSTHINYTTQLSI